MRIVVADDERPARFVLVSMLEELGYDPAGVTEAASGAELAQAVSSLKPACAFVDVRMPGMDGLAAIEAAAPSSRLTRWVIVSSFAEFDYARTAIRLGVNEYLLKPVRPEELGACLVRLGLGPRPPEEDPLLGPILDYLRRNFNGDVSVAEAAALAGLTPNYLSSLFRKRVGATISDYLARLRIEEAARLIGGGLSVAEAAREVGYADLRFFAAKFKEITGARPSDYKRG